MWCFGGDSHLALDVQAWMSAAALPSQRLFLQEVRVAGESAPHGKRGAAAQPSTFVWVLGMQGSGCWMTRAVLTGQQRWDGSAP